MKNTFFAVLALSLLTTHCAAQSQSLIPNSPSSSQTDSFRVISSNISNPCLEDELQSYKTLEELLDAGKTCHEAYILSSDISFFLKSDVDPNRILSMVKEEASDMASPNEFVVQNRPRLGEETAPLEIVIFSDFQCPFCARAAKTMHKLYEARPEAVSIVFKQMPLTNIHPYAGPAAIVTAYAQDKGKFWEIHDKFFDNQKSLDSTMIIDTLESLGTTQEELFDSAKGQQYGVTIVEDMQDANKAGVEGTPSVYVNGIAISGASSFDRMISLIDAAMNAPAPVSKETRAKARAKALAHCPYPGHEELYALLSSYGQADLSTYANSVLCPCAGVAESLHDCAVSQSCPAADSLIDKIITRINENTNKEDIIQEIEYIVQQERIKISP